MRQELLFLGSGNASSSVAGNSCLVILENNQPSFAIDYGPIAHHRYMDRFSSTPNAIFITHSHSDHIGGLEMLAYVNMFSFKKPKKTILYIPYTIIPEIVRKISSETSFLAECGENFFSRFQIIPVIEQFIHGGIKYNILPTRHHSPGSSYCIFSKGSWLYTGDTKPIPEIINHALVGNEIIFHDITLHSNPSHTGYDELSKNYTKEQIDKMKFYHSDDNDVEELQRLGLTVVTVGQSFSI